MQQCSIASMMFAIRPTVLTSTAMPCEVEYQRLVLLRRIKVLFHRLQNGSMLGFAIEKQHDVLSRDSTGDQRINEHRVSSAFQRPIRSVSAVIHTN